MHARFFRPGAAALTGALIALASLPAAAQKPQMLQSPHYRIYYAKEHEATAGEILRLSEAVWPALAKAYNAYDNYQIIDLFLSDYGDVANGSAIYPFSRVEIYLPHLNWVMRGRRNWLGNVVTHELAHVFSLRQKARLQPFSDAVVGGYTYNRKINWSLFLPWVPLAAPNWWIEGIAQFEAEQAGFDTWDSQRDMIVRDAWLTGTLPTLGQIETFDGNWLQAERVYNTGFAFLRYLKGRYGLEKVRELAFPKPWFHFGGAVKKTFGKSLPDLYAEWQDALAGDYGTFLKLPQDEPFEPGARSGFSQGLAFSPDGRYVAWLGNGDREYPLNWIYWKEAGDRVSGRSGQPVERAAAGEAPAPGALRQRPGPDGAANVFPAVHGGDQSLRPGFSVRPRPEPFKTDPSPWGRSREFGSAGLEFNHDGTRLLTTRNEWASRYSDIWEYAFLARGPEENKWHRLTWNERATDASYHPRLPNTVVFSKFWEGSSNVAVLDGTGRVLQLTRFKEGQQVYNPRFAPAGDSIYFTLGMDGKEAVVAIAANAAAWDPFAALEDSAAFPDSSYIAPGQRLRFVTPLEETSYRDLRFSGDTMLVSANGKDGVYNVFARVRGDTALYRLTRNRTQALEPQVRDGQLYYQGYRKQTFGLFRVPARFETEGRWPAVSDSLPATRPKRLEYEKAAKSGEPGVKKVAWSLSPYLIAAPQFLNDTTFKLNLNLGLQVALGPVSGGVSQNFSGYMSKQWDAHSPLSYGFGYGGSWSGVTAWHQRYGWTPNLSYGWSHDVRNYPHSTAGGYASDGTDIYLIEYESKPTLTYDNIYGFMSLPLDGMRVGPGYLGTSWYGRFFNEQIQDAGSYLEINQSTQEGFFYPGPLESGFRHRHLFHEAQVQWYAPAVGTPLPRYFAAFGTLGQWWARYADETIPNDAAGFSQALGDEEPPPFFQSIKQDFGSWQVNSGLVGAYSYEDVAAFSLVTRAGFFTHKFPRIYGAYAASIGDTVLVSYHHPNLWPLSYHIWDYLPAYPYSFSYRGRDILEGSAVASARVQADFPLKIRQYLDYPSLLSSLNKVQFSLIGDAGTVLDDTPDKLPGALSRGEHYLLMDYGAKLSATFLMYHWFPMELYGMVFMPYNQLKPENVYLDEWRGYASPEKYLENVKQPRFFIGFTFGGL